MKNYKYEQESGVGKNKLYFVFGKFSNHWSVKTDQFKASDNRMNSCLEYNEYSHQIKLGKKWRRRWKIKKAVIINDISKQ